MFGRQVYRHKLLYINSNYNQLYHKQNVRLSIHKHIHLLKYNIQTGYIYFHNITCHTIQVFEESVISLVY